MSAIVRVRLTGEEAHLGLVAAGDFARLLLGVERAVARAAGHVIGRQVKPKGRRGRTIEETTRLRLLKVEEGSVVGALTLPDETALDEETLGIETPSLGELALESALATVEDVETGQVDVAEVFVRLADEIGVGTRFDAISFERADQPDRKPIVLDRGARDRMQAAVKQVETSRPESLVGVLVEADFERHTARVRRPGGDPVGIQFPPELADEIQEALRKQAEFEGEVRYDPKTMQARDVQLRRIVRPEQLIMGLEPGEFWADSTVADLAQGLGVGPVEDASALHDTDATPDEIDRLLSALQDR
jgi:hypothetical protein